VVVLLSSAAGALLISVMFAMGLRGLGGWFSVHRIYRDRAGETEDSWNKIPQALRGWYFAVPWLVGYAVLASVVGLVLAVK
jgi:hypothetical protein